MTDAMKKTGGNAKAWAVIEKVKKNQKTLAAVQE
jgi:hypothetical protein